MLKIDQYHPFAASWNAYNGKLNPQGRGFFSNLAKKVYQFVFYIPNFFIAACINPRSETKFSPTSLILFKKNGNFKKEIITPDKVHLTAHIHLIPNATPQTPTVILFNPLGANQSVHRGLKDLLIQKDCNVVSFDYRGFGSTWRAGDLVVDGDSVYQYVTQELGISQDKTHFFGYSLGGAIALQVLALNFAAKGKYVGDRTFKSVFRLITENFCIAKLGCLIKKITSFISSIFIAYPVYLLGWEWNGSIAMCQNTNDILVIYHPKDILVPFEASLASSCPYSVARPLDPYSGDRGFSTHFAPIDCKSLADASSAAEVVADFFAH